MRPSAIHTRSLLFAVFTVSGFTGLIYESIWSHYLKLFLGHAAYAQTLVLAIFMGGLALGSGLAARFSGRVGNLLVAYALVEAIVGILALVFDGVYGAATRLAFDSVIPALGSAGSVQFFKWTLAALLILPQAVLLGTTFPLVSAGVIRRFPRTSGETLAMLYFTNSMGAAIGVLVSGFVLIEAVGLPGTIATAGVLNLALALIVWLGARNSPEAVPAPAEPASSANSPVRWILVAAAATGGASFFYEIAWIRQLSMVLGSATHSFELMLSAFITGLALGGLWVRKRLDGNDNPFRLLGIAMLATGVAAIATIPLYNSTFDVMARILAMLSRTAAGFGGFNLASHAIALVVMVPATFCAGMTLPVMTHILLRRGAGERAIGTVYAANTLGSIAGVILAVHAIMPVAGVKGLIAIGASIHMSFGIAALRRATTSLSTPKLLGWSAASAAFVLALWLGVTFDPLRMTSAVYRTGMASQRNSTKVLYLRDGKTATISLTEHNGAVTIATNGKPDAMIKMGGGPASPDEVTMTLAAVLPLMLHPNPQRVANIGIGSGLTSHLLLGSPKVLSLDSIEIEPLVAQAAHQGFMPRVRNLFEDPRSNIVFEDAKTFFAMTGKPYDIIVSEPSNPWVSGVATLFSDEFYARLVKYLKPQGLLVQWIQIYETDITIVASIAKAMAPHFADYAMYSVDGSNILLVAKKDGPLPALDGAIMQEPGIRDDLRRNWLFSVHDVENRRIGTRRSLQPLFASYAVPANSDFHPYVDLNAPRARFMEQSASALTSLNLLAAPITQLLGVGPILRESAPVPEQSFSEFDRAASDAVALRDAVLRHRVDSPVMAKASQLVTLGLSREECKDPGFRRAWRNAVSDFSVLTTPFLGAGDLQPLWTNILARDCYAQLTEEDRLFVDTLHAVAMRDVQEVASLGSRLVQSSWQPANSYEAANTVLSISASLIAVGRKEEAKGLLAQLLEVGAAEHELPIRMLMGISLQADAPPPASVGE